MSAVCGWGRAIYPEKPECPEVANVAVVLHDPDEVEVTSIPIPLCPTHVNAIAAESQPTTLDRVKGWVARWDQEGRFEHKPGHSV